jgi:hypothetical protein
MPRRLALPLIALLLLVPAAVSSASSKAAKPSIRVTGISVDDYNALPGTKITYVPNRPVNACYDIGGPSQTPQQVDVVFFIHAVGIPKNAPVTLDVVTPWDTQSTPNAEVKHPEFGSTWFTNKGHGIAAIFGGSDAPNNFYTYDDEGTRGDEFNGDYLVTTTVKVHGKILRAHGRLTIDC